MKYIDPQIKTFDSYRHYWSKAISAETLTNFPLHLDIELTSDCNLKCKMCWQYKDPNAFSKGMMDFSLFKKLIDEGVKNGLCAIKLQSRGEAMMHPKIFDYSKYAKDKGVLDIHLTTNGTLFLKKGKIDKLFNSGIDKLIFSIDDAHDESIDEIYKVKKPNIRSYFRKIGEIKKQRKINKPFLVVQTFCEKGEDKIKKKEMLEKEFPDADDFNINLLWESLPQKVSLKNLKENYKFLPCSYLWSRLLVYWDGTVTTCCRDYSGENLRLGDANKSNISELWKSPKMEYFRSLHFNDQRHKIGICSNCEISTIKLK